KREVARAGGVGHHRHRRNGREADDAVGAVILDGLHVRGGDDLVHFLPGRAHETAHAADGFVGFRLDRIADDGTPGFDRIHGAPRLAPQADELAAHHRILHAVGAVQIPGVGGAALTTARFVVGQIGTRARVVGLLRLPGDDGALDVHLPRARARTVRAVG